MSQLLNIAYFFFLLLEQQKRTKHLHDQFGELEQLKLCRTATIITEERIIILQMSLKDYRKLHVGFQMSEDPGKHTAVELTVLVAYMAQTCKLNTTVERITKSFGEQVPETIMWRH